MEKFTIKIGKLNVELELTFNPSTWNVYCKNDEIDFHGSIFNGHYNYNNKKVISYIDAKEFTFFRDEIENKIEKILIKNKILSK